MLNSSINSSLITLVDAAAMCENHLIECMVKDESGGLDRAASTMLAALKHIEKCNSKANDWDADLRKSKFLAARAVNAFQGGTEF